MTKRIKHNRLNTHLYFWAFFFTFLGYYTILLVLFNLGLHEATRSITIPIRLVISAFLCFVFVRNIKLLQPTGVLGVFLVFSIVYLTRLFLDYTNDRTYYMDIPQVMLYFLSFSVIPFVTVSTVKLNRKMLNRVFTSFLVGGILFSALAAIYYGRFIGEVHRLTTGVVGEQVISPLSLSYSSSLVIGVFFFYLLQNKVTFVQKIILIVGITMSMIPFFLGASRGSLIALLVPFIIYYFSGKSIGFRIKGILVLGFVFVGLVFLDEYLKSGLLMRFLEISEAIETGQSSAVRIEIWKTAIDQFLDYPILGDKLEINGVDGYAHNLFIETLQTTGILGFIPFSLLMYKAWKGCFYILKHHKTYFWVAVVFIQAFFMSMFSGAIYIAAWFWTSMALLFTLEYTLKKHPKSITYD